MAPPRARSGGLEQYDDDHLPDRAPRGRRDPNLAVEMELGEQEEPDEEVVENALHAGDEIFYECEVYSDSPVTRSARRFTYRVKTSVLPGETEPDAAIRAVLAVNTRLEQAIDDRDAREHERAEEDRRRPITPRR